jgi:predicted nucleic acid-binding Zn ribbon protein
MARPQPIADILSELMARRGFARVQSTGALQQAWVEAAGELLAKQSRAAAIKRGVLEVVVAHSAFANELSYQKPGLLARLAELLPDQKIRDLRVRVGPLD